jgi:membrane protease YdiL (CAAX protease family)
LPCSSPAPPYTFYQPLVDKDHDKKSLAVMDSSQSEFVMKLSSAFDDFLRESGMASIGHESDSKTKEMIDEMRGQALKFAHTATEHDPTSVAMAFRELIIAGESHNKARISVGLEKLGRMADSNAAAAAHLIEALYEKHEVAHASVPEGLTAIQTLTSRGWFRDVATIELYRAAADKAQAEKLLAEYHSRLQSYLLRVLCLLVTAVCLGLVGTLLFIGQFFFWPRKLTSDEDRALIAAPQDYGTLKIYGVLIGWLALECVCSPLMGNLAKFIKRPSGPIDPLTIGLTIFIFYTLNNAPSLILAWLIAIRPTGVRFLEAVKLRFKVNGQNRPFRLILAGVTAWLCAIPLIMASVVISKNLQSQGSANPILPIISEVVRSDSWFIIFLFVFVLGVMPALCEETLFRGFLYTSLRAKHGVFFSVVVSAAVFAAVHMDFGAFLQLFILGAVFALVMERTKSLVPSMVAHCLWNSGTLILMMVAFGG